MKRIRFPLLVVFALSIRLTLGSEAPALIDRPNADSGPTEISVGMWVVDISSIDSAQQTFTAEIAVVLRWKDPRGSHRQGDCALPARTDLASARWYCE